MLNIDINSLIFTLAISSIGTLGITALYRSIKTNWPESYTPISNMMTHNLRRRPFINFFIFRGGPVFLITLFTSVITERNGGYPWIGTMFLIITYLYLTDFRAIASIYHRPRHPQWIILIIYHIIAIIIVSTSSILAVYFREKISYLIPSERDILISLWAGIFSSILISVSRIILEPPNVDMFKIINQLRLDIGKENWSYISEVSNGDIPVKNILRAIILTEAQQRPRWFRRAERIKGLFIKHGTYGVAQTLSEKPISDKESIRALAKNIPFDHYIRDSSGEFSHDALREIFMKHNPNSRNSEIILDFYNYTKGMD